MKAVMVEWEDATSVDAWEDELEALMQEPHVIKSVGWLIREDKKSITIALSRDEAGGSISQYLVIPSSWIKKVVKWQDR